MWPRQGLQRPSYWIGLLGKLSEAEKCFITRGLSPQKLPSNGYVPPKTVVWKSVSLKLDTFTLQSSQSTSAPQTAPQATAPTFSGAGGSSQQHHQHGNYTQFSGFQSYSQALAPGVPPQQYNSAGPVGAPGSKVLFN